MPEPGYCSKDKYTTLNAPKKWNIGMRKAAEVCPLLPSLPLNSGHGTNNGLSNIRKADLYVVS